MTERIKVDYKVVDSFDELPDFDFSKIINSDIETDGLYLYTRLIQLFQPETSPLVWIIDMDIIDRTLDEIKAYLKPMWTLWQGCTYDFGTLNMTTDRFDDTLLLARTAYPEWKEFKLNKIVEKLGLGWLYEGLDKAAMQKAGFVRGAYLSHDQLQYASADVVALWYIWQNKKIQATREKLCYKVDILSIKHSIQYQQNRLVVHQHSVMKELDKLVDDIKKNEEILGTLNPNSPKQVKEFLGTDSSAKEVLIKIITEQGPQAEMAKAVYDQRRLLKRRTFLHSYNHPSCVTRFNPAGAATGRFTSTGKDLPTGINAQQITRDLQYIFNSDTEDTVVVHADYSTAELRAGCSIMRDAQMYEELKAGIDLHKIATTLAMGGKPEDVSKADRQKGKAISFGFIFGMSAASFVEYAYMGYGVIFTLEEATKIKKAYQKRYPQIAKYAQARWNDYKTVPVQTPLNRRNQARLGTDAINYATQGCIGETTKLAIHYLVSDYPEALNYIYNVVHDAVYLRVPKGTEEEWSHRLVDAMKKGWVEMCKRPMLFYKDIPMPVEVEYNDYSSGEAKYVCREV